MTKTTEIGTKGKVVQRRLGEFLERFYVRPSILKRRILESDQEVERSHFDFEDPFVFAGKH